MLSQRLLSRRSFINLSNNRLKNWTKKELFKVSTHLKLNSNKNLTNKQMFNNIKQFYNIEPKFLIHGKSWSVTTSPFSSFFLIVGHSKKVSHWASFEIGK